jgi:hypothetical protein
MIRLQKNKNLKTTNYDSRSIKNKRGAKKAD